MQINSPHFHWARIREVAKEGGGPNDLSHVQGCEDDLLALEIIEKSCKELRRIFEKARVP